MSAEAHVLKALRDLTEIVGMLATPPPFEEREECREWHASIRITQERLDKTIAELARLRPPEVG